jgi:hypothetical protein
MGVPPVILVDFGIDAYVTDGLGTTSQQSRKAEGTSSLWARKPSTISRQIQLFLAFLVSHSPEAGACRRLRPESDKIRSSQH